MTEHDSSPLKIVVLASDKLLNLSNLHPTILFHCFISKQHHRVILSSCSDVFDLSEVVVTLR